MKSQLLVNNEIYTDLWKRWINLLICWVIFYPFFMEVGHQQLNGSKLDGSSLHFAGCNGYLTGGFIRGLQAEMWNSLALDWFDVPITVNILWYIHSLGYTKSASTEGFASWAWYPWQLHALFSRTMRINWMHIWIPIQYIYGSRIPFHYKVCWGQPGMEPSGLYCCWSKQPAPIGLLCWQNVHSQWHWCLKSMCKAQGSSTSCWCTIRRVEAFLHELVGLG